MRNFSINSWFDTDNNFLHGRVSFWKADGSALENVYNREGQVISNPIYTNSLGQASQEVFLGNCDYLVKFEKYIGMGDFSTDSEEWVFQYSYVDKYKIFDIEINSNTLSVVGSMNELHGQNPELTPSIQGKHIVLRLGYQEPGDHAPVYYYWDATSTENDDAGAIVAYGQQSVGRWKFVENQFEKWDVRFWGAFPQINAAETSQDQSNRIYSAYSWATERTNTSIVLRKGNVTEGRFYRLDKVSYGNCMYIEKDVCIVIPTGYNVTLNLQEYNEFELVSATGYMGALRLNGKHLHMDCGDHSRITYDPTERLDIDVNDSINRVFVNVDVYMKPGLTTGHYSFINCRLSSNQVIGNGFTVSFRNMEIFDSYFTDDNVTLDNATFYNCYSDTEDWKSNIHRYIRFWNKNNEKCLDLKNYPLTAEEQINRDCIVKNVALSTYGLTFGGGMQKVILQNCNGIFRSTNNSLAWEIHDSEVYIGSNDVSSIKGYDSNITMYDDLNSEIATLELHDCAFNAVNAEKITGSISLYDTNVLTAMDIRDTATNYFFNAIISGNISAVKINMYNCFINSNMIATSDVIADNCKINATISQNCTENGIFFAITNCNFLSAGQHVVNGNGTNLLTGTWINNYAISTNPVIVQNVNTTESSHSYTYSNNKGTFKPHWKEHLSYDNSLYYTYDGTEVTDNCIWVQKNDNYHEWALKPMSSQGILNLFAIGTDMLVSATYGISDSNSGLRDYMIFGTTILQLVKIGTNTYRAVAHGNPVGFMNYRPEGGWNPRFTAQTRITLN